MTTFSLIINEDDLRRTSTLLSISPDTIREAIHSRLRPFEASYLTTGGWIAHTWLDEHHQTHVKVSLTPYTVERLLKR